MTNHEALDWLKEHNVKIELMSDDNICVSAEKLPPYAGDVFSIYFILDPQDDFVHRFFVPAAQTLKEKFDG